MEKSKSLAQPAPWPGGWPRSQAARTGIRWGENPKCREKLATQDRERPVERGLYLLGRGGRTRKVPGSTGLQDRVQASQGRGNIGPIRIRRAGEEKDGEFRAGV